MRSTLHTDSRSTRRVIEALLLAGAFGIFFALRAGVWTGSIVFCSVLAGVAHLFLVVEIVDGVRDGRWRARAWRVAWLVLNQAHFSTRESEFI